LGFGVKITEALGCTVKAGNGFAHRGCRLVTVRFIAGIAIGLRMARHN
jgi:hypothetical protein